MPRIRFVKNYPEIEVETGANLMRALLDHNMPVASSCLGDGICGRCKLVVVDGMAHLSAQGTLEEILRERLRIPRDSRISCQTQVLGDVTLDASYW